MLSYITNSIYYYVLIWIRYEICYNIMIIHYVPDNILYYDTIGYTTILQYGHNTV